MQLNKLVSALLLSFAAVGSASAVTFNGSTGGVSVTDYSAGSLLSFDLDVNQLGTSVLTFGVEASDLVSGSLSFNALVRNLTGFGIPSAYLQLNGATFSGFGTVTTDGFQSVSNAGANTIAAWAQFSPALTTEFYIGNPLSVQGSTDWTINLAGKSAGDTFTMMVAVPEPESYAMLLAGLGLVGFAAKRRQQA